MNKSRRIGTMLALATATIGMVTALATAPAAASSPKDRGPAPAGSWLNKVSAYGDTWIKIYWVTGKPACDVKVRVRAEDVSVYYPNGKRFTSPYRGDMLKPGKKDYTAIRVDPALKKSGIAKLLATISYRECGPHGHAMKKTFSLALPVVTEKPGHGGGPLKPGY